MTHKPHAILLLLGLVLATSVIPAHASSITIDESIRFLELVGLTPYVITEDHSSGTFSEMAAVSQLVLGLGEMSLSAAQISDISLLGNVLIVNIAERTHFSTPIPGPLTEGVINLEANSNLGLTFTVDNWAFYDAPSFVKHDGNLFLSRVFIQSFTGSTIFETEISGGPTTINTGHSGLLSPGTYIYRSLTAGAFNYPEHHINGGTLVFSSLTVSIVPEPSTLLLLACGLALLARWRSRQLAT